ncbi:MAG: hypothetical protein ACUVS7_16290 [Bryobacteraceae bacterium]
MTRLALLLMAMMVAPAGAQETGAAPPAAAPLLQIHHVYLLPMANGFDQHLAHHLTRQGLLQVVADPARADAILTDRLGKPFEQRLEELYPEAKPAPGAKAKEDEEAEEKGAAGMDLKVTPLERPTSFGRGKGTVFLVHRGSRAVVWSTYERPRRTTPDELDRSARRVTDRLGKAIREAGKPRQ